MKMALCGGRQNPPYVSCATIKNNSIASANSNRIDVMAIHLSSGETTAPLAGPRTMVLLGLGLTGARLARRGR